MTVYFVPNIKSSGKCEGVGYYYGVSKFEVGFVPPFFATGSNVTTAPDESLNTTVYGTHAGVGGYDRVGFRLKLPVWAPTQVTNAIIKVDLDISLSIRSMENPETTDFKWSFDPGNCIMFPHGVVCYENTDLRPDISRYLALGLMAFGAFNYEASEKWILLDLNWKDKTGVEPEPMHVTMTMRQFYYPLDMTVVPIPPPGTYEDSISGSGNYRFGSWPSSADHSMSGHLGEDNTDDSGAWHIVD